MELVGGGLQQALVADVEIIGGYVVAVSLEEPGAIEPRSGGRVISEVNVVLSDDGESEVAVRIQFFGSIANACFQHPACSGE